MQIEKYNIGDEIIYNNILYVVYNCGELYHNSNLFFWKAKSKCGKFLHDEEIKS